METAGVEPGSAEMELILDERAVSSAAWRGWPRKSAVAILVSIVVYFASIVMSTTELASDDVGNDSTIMLVLRAVALAHRINNIKLQSGKKGPYSFRRQTIY